MPPVLRPVVKKRCPYGAGVTDFQAGTQKFSNAFARVTGFGYWKETGVD